MDTKKQYEEIDQFLDNLFANEDADLSIATLYQLSDLPPAQLQTFKARWLTMPDERRQVVARHLADIAEENFQVDFSPLCEQLLDDPLPEVRQAALDSLWDTSNIRLVPTIIRVMQEDAQTGVRAVAAATLGHFVLMAQWNEVPRHVEKPIVEALVPIVEDEALDPALRRAALESLSGSPHPRVNAFIERAYEDSDQQMQQSAIFAMGRTADRRWLPTLLAELEHHDPEMRAEAARAAGGLGSAEACPPLVEMAYYDEDLEVRLTAVTALGQIGGSVASRALTELSEDPEAADLAEAIDEALEELGWMSGELDLSLLDYDEDDEEWEG